MVLDANSSACGYATGSWRVSADSCAEHTFFLTLAGLHVSRHSQTPPMLPTPAVRIPCPPPRTRPSLSATRQGAGSVLIECRRYVGAGDCPPFRSRALCITPASSGRFQVANVRLSSSCLITSPALVICLDSLCPLATLRGFVLRASTGYLNPSLSLDARSNLSSGLSLSKISRIHAHYMPPLPPPDRASLPPRTLSSELTAQNTFKMYAASRVSAAHTVTRGMLSLVIPRS